MLPENKPTRVLITGIAGFIGSRFSEWILENCPNVEVIGVDSFEGGYQDNLDPRIELTYPIKVEDSSLTYLLRGVRPDYVFHFAAFAAEGLSPFVRTHTYTSNIVATSNLVNACIDSEVKRLVFTSSMAVYGKRATGNGIVSEELLPRPVDPYGIAKFACEQDIISAGDQFGLDWCILRPHNVFGEKQNIWDPYRNVLGIWMNRISKGKSIEIYGDGKQVRSFSYIEDMLPCIWQAAVSPKASHHIINLGSKEHMTVLEAANILKEIVQQDGFNPEINFQEARYEVNTIIPTYLKSEWILGYRETVSFREGIQRMWNWAKTQPDRKVNWLPSYELKKGMYTYWRGKSQEERNECKEI